RTNTITGCEALLRWSHPKLGTRLPNEFMKALEETTLITKIGQWVLLEACKAAVTWPAHIRLAVNVSAVQLQDAKLLSMIVKALNVSTLPARRLEIEVTETAVIDDSDQVLAADERRSSSTSTRGIRADGTSPRVECCFTPVAIERNGR